MFIEKTLDNDINGLKSIPVSERSINKRDEFGNTPLHLAAYLGYEDIFDYLVSIGSDINAKNYNGETPLYMSTYLNSDNIFNKIISSDNFFVDNSIFLVERSLKEKYDGFLNNDDQYDVLYSFNFNDKYNQVKDLANLQRVTYPVMGRR